MQSRDWNLNNWDPAGEVEDGEYFARGRLWAGVEFYYGRKCIVDTAFRGPTDLMKKERGQLSALRVAEREVG